MPRAALTEIPIEVVPIENLTPHPKNYQEHPDDQVEHVVQSIRDHGFYRPIVVAKDGTILAGHGLLKAATKLGVKKVPIRRLPLAPDHPLALKVLAGDNETPRLAERDDRALSELLKGLKDLDVSLLGTGFDEMMLANLVFVTRPEDEIADIEDAAEWVGMPSFDKGKPPIQIVVSCEGEEQRDDFCRRLGLTSIAKRGKVLHTWWPPRERNDLASLRVEIPAEAPAKKKSR